MIIAGTGHRKLGNSYDLDSPICKWLKNKILEIFNKYEPDTVISGIALMWDQLLAITALQQNIRTIASIPCLNQHSVWPKKSQEIYWSILNNPLCEIHYCQQTPYDNKCMQKRNIWMVDQIDTKGFLLSCFDGSPGGTANCINYAKKQNKKIININPKDFYE